jgi:predicted Zn finger-like uncharacterized protein
MRLTCPNCNAQYEVDERVIPQNGRDVQCSACGNTWYQYPMEVALQMRAAELDDDDDEDLPAPRDGAGRAATPRIDQTVLDVLREEAEREMSERQRSRAALETQGDLGLVTAPQRSKAAPSRIYGEPDPEAPSSQQATVDEPSAAPAPARRNLLPDIEELTSSLEPGSQAREEDEADGGNESAPDRGFRRGVSTVMMIALALVLVYVLAPTIATYIPAAEGVLRGYVTMIDGLRANAAALLRQVFGG